MITLHCLVHVLHAFLKLLRVRGSWSSAMLKLCLCCVQDAGGAAPERLAPLRLCCAAGAEHGVCQAPRRRHALYLLVLMVRQQLSSMLLEEDFVEYI